MHNKSNHDTCEEPACESDATIVCSMQAWVTHAEKTLVLGTTCNQEQY